MAQRLEVPIFQYESASLRLKPLPITGFFILVNLYSVTPRKGHATELMKIVTKWADENKAMLLLEPRLYGNPHGMPTELLPGFYGRFGFEWHTSDIFMRRVPQDLHGL